MGADATAGGMNDCQDAAALAAAVKQEALRIGFDLVGIVPAVCPGHFDRLSRLAATRALTARWAISPGERKPTRIRGTSCPPCAAS